MENRETHQINEFEKLIDDIGNEYAIFEYQEGIEKRPRKSLHSIHAPSTPVAAQGNKAATWQKQRK
jgi:hypothetical protein